MSRATVHLVADYHRSCDQATKRYYSQYVVDTYLAARPRDTRTGAISVTVNRRDYPNQDFDRAEITFEVERADVWWTVEEWPEG